MGRIERFSTAGVAPSKRRDYWNRLCGDTLSRTVIDTPQSGFEAEMLRWRLGEVTLLRPRSDIATVRRAPAAAGDAGAAVVLHLQHHGRARYSRPGVEAELAAGDFVLSAADAGYRFDLTAGHELLVVEMPRAPLEARLPQLERHFCRRNRTDSAGGRVFHEFLLSLWRHGDLGATDPEWQAGIAGVLADLMGMAVRAPQAPAARSGRGAGPLAARVLSAVEARLCDPELSTRSLAEELGVTPRTVQKVFAGMATTPSAHILHRRLDRAADLLRGDRRQSVTDIAFGLGFNDSAYFTRCFRRHFGTAPSRWRG